MYQEEHRIYQWGGWWYLEHRTRPAIKGRPWGDWEHVASHPHMSWLTTHYQKEVAYAEASRRG